MSRTPLLKQVTIIDALAALLSLVALGGVIWSPRIFRSYSITTGSPTPVSVSVDINAKSANPKSIISSIIKSGNTKLVLENNFVKQVSVERVIDFSSMNKGYSELSTNNNITNNSMIKARLILNLDASVSNSGLFVSGKKIQIGLPVAIEGYIYKFNGHITDITMP